MKALVLDAPQQLRVGDWPVFTDDIALHILKR